MYCGKCGHEVSDEVNFCEYCGMKINRNVDDNLFRDSNENNQQQQGSQTRQFSQTASRNGRDKLLYCFQCFSNKDINKQKKVLVRNILGDLFLGFMLTFISMNAWDTLRGRDYERFMEQLMGTFGWLYAIILFVIIGGLALSIYELHWRNVAEFRIYENHIEGVVVVGIWRIYKKIFLRYEQILDVQLVGKDVLIIIHGNTYKCFAEEYEMMYEALTERLVQR